MKVVIVSDIFGKTKELISLCDSLNLPCDIIDPYSGKLMHFKDEPEAYDYFMNNVHIKIYSELLQNFIGAVSEPLILLGFSIGATAIWNISENLKNEIVTRSICFYSSQIRKYTSIIPCIDTDLVFPSFEPRFSVLELSECLSKKKNVKVHNTPYLHGFMNKLSKNFSQDGYQEYTRWICSSIS